MSADVIKLYIHKTAIDIKNAYFEIRVEISKKED